ncbi:MAG TPA: hypothetical protein VJV74_15495 [Terriglobia bacterium]|nr:hypothetical protein [Terriglobia bacterium]
MEKENHLATPEDFRQAALAHQNPPERVVLPQLGRAVLLRRPTPMWFVFRGRLPQSLAVRAFPGLAVPGETGSNTDRAVGASGNAVEELTLLADWILTLLEEVMVSPRVSLQPDAGEISPDLLDSEDVNFIIRWAYGEVGSGARDDLVPFRAERQPAAAGAGGGDVVVPSK